MASEPSGESRFETQSAKSIFRRAKFEPALQITLTVESNLEALKKRILKQLEDRRACLPQLRETKKELGKLKRESKSQVEIERCEAEIAAVEAAVELVESGKEIETFEAEVAPLLQDHAKMFPNAGVLSFGGRQPFDGDAAQKIIMEFAEIAEKYCSLDVHYVYTPDVRVCVCGRSLEKSDNFCPSCQFPVACEPSAPTERKDTDYEAKENFKRDFARCQGKIHNQIPSELYESLDAYFLKHRVPPGKIIRNHFKLAGPEGNRLRKRIGRNANGDIIETSIRMMVDALRDTGNPGYYSDVHYICQQYWGWQLPDLSHIEDAVMNHDYDAVQAEYNKLIHNIREQRNSRFAHFKERKSSINCPYRLWAHLRARGHPCSEEDFKVVTLDHLQMENRKLLRQVFLAAGLPLPEDS